MPTETLPKDNRAPVTSVREKTPKRDEDTLRQAAVRHLEDVRKFKRYLAAYLLSLLVLTPVWIVTQYESADGWPEHLSTRSRYPGDWDPWIIWVALGGGVIVAFAAYRAFMDRPTTEDDIEREVERLRTR